MEQTFPLVIHIEQSWYRSLMEEVKAKDYRVSPSYKALFTDNVAMLEIHPK
jgi:hypothetical protein